MTSLHTDNRACGFFLVCVDFIAANVIHALHGQFTATLLSNRVRYPHTHTPYTHTHTHTHQAPMERTSGATLKGTDERMKASHQICRELTMECITV